jgi:cytochrome c oxidase assembly factor CtaG
MPPPATDAAFHLGLLIVSLWFWLPVIGPRPLTEAAQCVYLFLAMPTMDLAGVYVVLHGDAGGGLAMIVAMLPVGVVAVVRTWQWIVREERLASRPAALLSRAR